MWQMNMLRDSGLADAATEIIVGINGGEESESLIRLLVPEKASILFHGTQQSGELPTMMALQRWVATHPNWLVCYHHTKGITHPHDLYPSQWRARMTHFVITQWRKCVEDLSKGFDTVGCHWLTNSQFPAQIQKHQKFWGGNFWWAQSNFLASLPRLTVGANYYAPEQFIGTGRMPTVKDYYPGWP